MVNSFAQRAHVKLCLAQLTVKNKNHQPWRGWLTTFWYYLDVILEKRPFPECVD